MLLLDVTIFFTLTTANRMLQNCQVDIRGKSYNKYDPGYAVPRR